MKNIELRGQRAELIKGATAIVDAAQKEGRSLNAEEKSKFDAMEADARSIKDQIDIIERTAEMKKELAANAEVREAAPKATRKGAFEKYLRNGMGALNANERSMMAELRGTSTQIAGTDSLGGFLVPQDFSNELDMATLFTGEVERLSKEIEHGGWRIVGLPYNQRHGNGCWFNQLKRRRNCSRYDIRKRAIVCLQLRITSSRFNAIVARQRIRFERVPC